MSKHIEILLVLLFPFVALAQTSISGKLVDEQGKGVENVSVSYQKIGGTAILGFGRTDREGLFSLSVTVTDVDSIQLDFNHMSYARQIVIVANRTADHTFTLKMEARQIEEVRVADTPVFRRRDTINYHVEAFSSAQDRVIADIIRKLPGIEMEGDQILYQGKPIQKYMVNNLDLMEGRYSMINKNLPADAVKNVQIIENDQPIKVLDSLVFSDRASLNLELKRFTHTGSGKIGIGAKPLLWDINLTPMTFGETFQVLNSLQTNNVGVDVSRDLRAFYTGGGYLSGRTAITDGPNYISLRNVPSPGFEERKWLDNNIFLFSTNVLQKLQSGIELKGNVSYYDDTKIRRGFTTTQYFMTDETIVSTEVIDNRYRANVFDGGILLEKNEKNVYLRNMFKYHKRWNSDVGSVLLNEEVPITQRRAYTDEALMNSLSLARFIGRQLVNIGSNIEWHRTPQRLFVSPGQFEDLLNDGNPFEQMGQLVRYDGLNWTNNLGFTRRIKRWRLSPNVTLNYNRNKLDTDIEIRDGQDSEILGGDYHNAMLNSQLQLGLIMGVGWENQQWKTSISLPYNLFYFNVEQQAAQTLNNVLRNTVNPSGSLTYIMDSRNEWSITASGGNQYGGLNNFYNGFIISEYRDIRRYDARLLGTTNLRTGLRYNYRNILKANFANFGYNYSRSTQDYIYETWIDELGRLSTGIGDRKSQTLSHRVNAGLSRFLSPAKTVVKLNANTGWSASDYLLNEVMARQKSFNYGGSLEVINNLSSIVSGEYRTTLGQTHNRLAAGRINNIFYNHHFLTLLVSPVEHHSITLTNSYYHNNIPGQADQYFLDAVYRFTWNRKRKWDIELIAQNLLNNDNYIQQFSSDYQVVQSTFELRPRQFLISTKFSF